MSTIETGFKATNIIIGVDTHKSTCDAVAINEQIVRLTAISIPANSKDYIELNNWTRSLGSVHAFGIEGTGSYGAAASALSRKATVPAATRATVINALRGRSR